ncbi:MAG TPA: flavin reductase family protein [Candidatus Omnitrophota bacterium]|nr:flavin reductase family protein [Candidatus Omnitrophota bacterium]HPN88528.1 flavin reductase family protein [Candidatus Omnitrophota bacterium]
MKKSIGAQTIVFPTPVFIVGSYDKKGQANMMNAAWGGICSSVPPSVSVSIRPARYTYQNIIQKKAFTVNIPSTKYIKEADYFGIASGKKENKLKKAELTAIKSDIVDAPYIKEFPFILECALLKTLEVGAHTIFVGEIKDIKVDENCLNEKGQPDMEKIKPFSFDPATGRYFEIGKYLANAFSVGLSIQKE